MKPSAIVYTSAAGHTQRYARLLELLGRDADCVSAENLAAVLRWYEEQ